MMDKPTNHDGTAPSAGPEFEMHELAEARRVEREYLAERHASTNTVGPSAEQAAAIDTRTATQVRTDQINAELQRKREARDAFRGRTRAEPELHALRVVLTANPADSVIELDGAPLHSVERVTLVALPHAPPRLTIVQLGEHAGGDVSVSDEGSRTVREFAPGGSTRVDLQSVVELIEESATASLSKPGPWNALHVFMIKTNADERAATLEELVIAAERYRALVRALEERRHGVLTFAYDNATSTDTLESIAYGARELDAMCDELKLEHTQAGDGEPRRPV